MSPLIVGVALPWLVVGLCVLIGCWLGFQLVHQNGRLLSHLEALEQRLGQVQQAAVLVAPQPPSPAPAPQPAPPPALPVGSLAPEFELPDLNGRRRKLADFRGKNLLLIFFNPRCGFCTRMAPDIATLPTDGAGGAPIPLVVTTGELEENRALFAQHGIQAPVLLQEQMNIGSQYHCSGTPMGYLIDAQGKIASELAIGAQALLALTGAPAPAPARSDGHAAPPARSGEWALGGKRGVEERRIERNGLPAGTPAPDFRLPLLHGGELSLSEYRGRKVLLVFSDPNCGPCEQLMPQLEQQYRARRGVQVLMVSRGEAEANRAKASQHGLTFPVVLQKGHRREAVVEEVSRAYGKFAAPIAYLIDEEGLIAKEVAIGIEPILSLLSEPVIPTNGKAVRRERELAGRRR